MFQVACIVGGMSEEKQQRVLRGSPEVVVGTPGRLWHLIEQVRIKVISFQNQHTKLQNLFQIEALKKRYYKKHIHCVYALRG